LWKLNQKKTSQHVQVVDFVLAAAADIAVAATAAAVITKAGTN
jgi:hypothetical protein